MSRGGLKLPEDLTPTSEMTSFARCHMTGDPTLAPSKAQFQMVVRGKRIIKGRPFGVGRAYPQADAAED